MFPPSRRSLFGLVNTIPQITNNFNISAPRARSPLESTRGSQPRSCNGYVVADTSTPMQMISMRSAANWNSVSRRRSSFFDLAAR